MMNQRTLLIKEFLKLLDSGKLKGKERIVIKFEDGSQVVISIYFEAKKEILIKLVK